MVIPSSRFLGGLMEHNERYSPFLPINLLRRKDVYVQSVSIECYILTWEYEKQVY